MPTLKDRMAGLFNAHLRSTGKGPDATPEKDACRAGGESAEQSNMQLIAVQPGTIYQWLPEPDHTDASKQRAERYRAEAKLKGSSQPSNLGAPLGAPGQDAPQGSSSVGGPSKLWGRMKGTTRQERADEHIEKQKALQEALYAEHVPGKKTNRGCCGCCV